MRPQCAVYVYRGSSSSRPVSQVASGLNRTTCYHRPSVNAGMVSSMPMTPADQAKQTSSEKKLSAIWELAGDAMVFIDNDGVLDCNDAALRFLGLDSREQAIGVPLHAFAPPTQPDGRPSARVFAEGRLRAIQ